MEQTNKKINGFVMSGDTVVAEVNNSDVKIVNSKLAPLYFMKRNDIKGWLGSRAIDEHRTNSRLLKKVLRLHTSDNVQVAMSVYGATVTDNFWFKPSDINISYENVKFKENYFDNLALRGDMSAFHQHPSKTPELTNIGSFEKCWRIINGEWWMYKNENDNEKFSELFIYNLGHEIGLPFAYYDIDNGYIRTKNFLSGTEYNFEPMSSLTDNDDYANCFSILYSLSKELAKQYLQIIWFDSICMNVDRHTGNFGLIRDQKTGDIISLSPNYDNNVALISNGYIERPELGHTGFISFFRDFISNCPDALSLYQEMDLPLINEEIIQKCLDNTPFAVDDKYITQFILDGYEQVSEIIDVSAPNKNDMSI